MQNAEGWEKADAWMSSLQHLQSKHNYTQAINRANCNPTLNTIFKIATTKLFPPQNTLPFFLIDQFIIFVYIKSQKNAQLYFPEPKATSINGLFCPTDCQKYEDSEFERW